MEMAAAVTVKTAVATEIAVAVRRGRGMASERTSAYECSFQGQPYMGHYISGVLE
jgi:hypothetical protein